LIAFGTTLDPQAQMCESQQLAKSVANPTSSQWRAKGDQHRSYRFAAANATVNYRIVIPSTWDGTSKLPMVMFLHSGFGNENTNLDENNGLLVNLAIEHGYALVSPLGYQGAYGNHLALPAVFGQPTAAAQQIAAITSASERTNQLSEKDVINVLEIVLNEYPIDRKAMFLTGHSMGAGGTWYIGAKYPSYWTAFATLSGPFVQETGYPWESIRLMPNFITEGNNTAGTTASRALYDYMLKKGFNMKFKEVAADHGGMIPLVLPDVFKFFDSCRAH
jgi:poly(3-hydroxybutyrate) depolymerase